MTDYAAASDARRQFPRFPVGNGVDRGSFLSYCVGIGENLMSTTVAKLWKTALADRLPSDMAKEIDVFETQMELRRQGKLDEKVFAETRLRRGAYGQRYDNGQRHDGVDFRALPFPSGELTKGPHTLWDAPGMQRIKIPFGRLSPEQLEVLAEVAEEHSDDILHITTRQDVQLHFVHIGDTPTIMRRIASVGVTTREACGNSVRNVTGCPKAGVCGGEAFDTTPYSHALTYFMLGHPDIQDMGRKFKISFSGCKEDACALASIHDIGLVARREVVDGVERRGFEMYVGGGLGPVPQHAQLFDAFVPERELLPLSLAICRVFARLGEKQNRSRARMKFLVTKLGIDEFRRLVLEERARLPHDGRWTAFLEDLDSPEHEDRPSKAPAPLPPGEYSEAFEAWRRTNVAPQRQPGYAIATVRLPLGDLTSTQARGLAKIARELGETVLRTTVEQNIVVRWVPEAELPALFDALDAIGLSAAGAGTIEDITSCPGTDTCKLGISSSRGLASELVHQIGKRKKELPMAVQGLRIKASGCFNSCGQHHIADIGFLGVSRNVKNRRSPHFQLVIGGQWTNNAGAYGLAVGAVPSKRVDDVVRRVTDHYVQNRAEGESFQDFYHRIGRKAVRTLIEDLLAVPTYDQDPSYYRDWGDPREYTIGDMGVGECAGEVVSLTAFGLADSERHAFEAQEKLEQADPHGAAQLAYKAMLEAARALVRLQQPDVGEVPDRIVDEFRTRFHDTKLFHDPFVGGNFANYLFRTHESPPNGVDADGARRHIQEAQLFIEAVHACYDRLTAAAAE